MKHMAAMRWATAAVAGALVLTACSSNGDSGGDNSGGDGVAFGATKAEYQKAFEDVDPITVITQTTGPKGLDTFSGSKEEAYMAAIEDWSGGKIKFDISYSYAIAPIAEADDAVADGRLDMAALLPSIEPSDYPAYNELVKGGLLAADGNPVIGPMLTNAYMSEVGFEVPEIAKEFEDHGMHMVLPSYSMVPQGVFCSSKRQSLSDFKGSVVATSNKTVAQLLKAAGASPTSIPYTEAFEALQRGALDCAQSSVAISTSTGVSEPAPYAMTAGEASLGNSPGALTVRTDFWNKLPLVAKQLFYDRADAFYENWVGGQIAETAKAIALAEKNGGGAFPFDDEVQQLLIDDDKKVFDTIRDAKVVADADGMADALQKSHDKWLKIITDDLGIDSGMTLADLPAWLEKQGGKVDLSKYLEKFGSEIIAKNRPS